jgi:NADPH:quinone reductase-like Zn-dependent oxidoreductase
VLVRVRATTVNRTDCRLRAAKPWIYRLFLGLRRPRRPVLGTEFAGEVEAVGDGVTAFKGRRPGVRVQRDHLRAHAEYLVVR